MSGWFTYIVRCADATLYTGVTTDLDRRLAEHNAGAAAAKYTRARRPVEMVYAEPVADRAAACRREHQIRRLDTKRKRLLIQTWESIEQ